MPDNTQLLLLLQEHLAPYTTFHKQRLRFVASFLRALIQLSTVNLAQLALAFSARPESNYRRIQRFFAEAKLPQQAVAALVLHLLPRPTTGQRFVISIDRTEWHFGKTPVNILMAAIVYQGTAFPLVWVMLGKAGSSSGAEQRALLRKLLLIVPPAHIRVVLADREFIGRPFMGYLSARGVGYGLRVRKDARVGFRGSTQRADHLFRDLAVGQYRRLRARRMIYGHQVWLYGLRLPDAAGGAPRLLLVAGTVRRLLSLYRLRWGIEVLFAGLKSRGFDFETTHLNIQQRISTLVGLLAIAYGFAHATGRYLAQQRPIRLKRHGRAARSVFRLGLDHLRHVLLQRLEQLWQGLLSLFVRGALGPAPAPV